MLPPDPPSLHGRSAMRKMLTLAGLVLALALVTPLDGADDNAAPKDNMPPEGFTALFTGKDLTGWKADGKVKEHWTIVDGILTYDGKGGSLVTAKSYANIELFVDWKIAKGGDSGIYLRGNPQVQIWDNKEGSGGLFNNQKNPSKPLKVADKPVGQWNTFRILMKGDKVTVYLNGELVVDKTPLENYFKKGEPLPAKGPIELQHHGDPLWFKNIYIKELPDE